MARLVEENLTCSFCSTCKTNVLLVSRWHWVIELSCGWGCFGVNSKPVASLLNSCWILTMRFSDFCCRSNGYDGYEHFCCCIWRSCQSSISLCQLSAMTDTPFGFCMLTSVDKMFIRFIFAKDMQLHYIWYYEILIKTCSC